MANDKNDTTDFWSSFGVALIILAIFVGVGSCFKLSDLDGHSVKMEREKTRQLEIQLKIEEIKNETKI